MHGRMHDTGRLRVHSRPVAYGGGGASLRANDVYDIRKNLITDLDVSSNFTKSVRNPHSGTRYFIRAQFGQPFFGGQFAEFFGQTPEIAGNGWKSPEIVGKSAEINGSVPGVR